MLYPPFVILHYLAAFALLIPATLLAAPLERDVLEEINLARTQPQLYAKIIAHSPSAAQGSEGTAAVNEAVKYLRKARPLPPLRWSEGISQAAQVHAEDVGGRGARGHKGSDGTLPWDRMALFGERQGYAGENIDYGRRDPRAIVISLIVDHGVKSRAHRKNIFSKNYRVAGVALAAHARWGSLCVVDFATSFSEGVAPRVASRSDPGYRSQYSGISFF